MQGEYSLRPSVPPAKRDWVDGVRDGDPAAFAAIFNAYYNRLWVYVQHYVHTRDTAEEIVQELFVRIWARHTEWEVRDSRGHEHLRLDGREARRQGRRALRDATEKLIG